MKSLTGAEGQNRTADTGIFSPLLYRLSYLGTGNDRNGFYRSRYVLASFFFGFCIFFYFCPETLFVMTQNFAGPEVDSGCCGDE